MKLLAVFVTLAVLIVMVMAIGQGVGRSVGQAVRQAAPGPQTFDSNGVKIRYTVEGKGDPVILIHGLTSSADLNWRLPGIVKSLAETHQVIALDVRGHGWSDKPEAEAEYGVQMVEDVVRLMDHLKIPKAKVAGYSMGGMIAMKLMVAHPDRVHSVALCGMGWMKQGGPLQSFWSNLRVREQDGPLAFCAKSFGALAVTEKEVKAIKTPVAIIIGDSDPVKGLYVDPLLKVRPDWPVTVIDGAGHITCVAKPQFRDELKKWADAREPGRAAGAGGGE